MLMKMLNGAPSRLAGTAARVALSGIIGVAALPAMAEDDQSRNATDLSSVHVRHQTHGPDKKTALTSDPSALPTTVTTVDAAEISTLNVGRDMSGIFHRVPGVVANNIDQGDTGNGFRMRGFATQGTHGADTAVLIDGVPQNIPSSQGGAGHGPVFLEWLSPGMIGHLSVIKGPISALYGDQNRAGSVDMVTLDPADAQSSIGAEFGSYGLRRYNFVYASAFDGIDSVFIADHYRIDGYRLASQNHRDNVFWKLAKDIGDARYSLRVSHYESDSMASGYLLEPEVKAGLSRRSVQYNLPGFGDANRTSIVFNRVPHADEGWSATGYAETFKRERAITTSSTQHTVGDDNRRMFGGRLLRSITDGHRASATIGVEARVDNGSALRRQYRNNRPTANYINNFDMDLRTYGIFFQGQYLITQTFKASLGMRHVRFDYDINNLKFPGASTHYRGKVTTPKFGLAWAPRTDLEFFANVAQGFRSPAAEQLSVGSTSAAPLYQSGGMATPLAPSKVQSYDVGVTVRPAGGLSASLTGYAITNDDEIVQTAPEVYKAVGRTKRKGYEFEVSWKRGEFNLYANYGRIIRAALANPAAGTGARLTVPEGTYKAGAQYRFAAGSGNVILNADAYHLAGIPYYVGKPQTTERIMSPYTRYDVRATWDIERWQASAYATFMPHAYGTEVAYGTASGLLFVAQPSSQYGVSVRYYF